MFKQIKKEITENYILNKEIYFILKENLKNIHTSNNVKDFKKHQKNILDKTTKITENIKNIEDTLTLVEIKSNSISSKINTFNTIKIKEIKILNSIELCKLASDNINEQLATIEINAKLITDNDQTNISYLQRIKHNNILIQNNIFKITHYMNFIEKILT